MTTAAGPSHAERVRSHLGAIGRPAQNRLAEALGVPRNERRGPDPNAIATALASEAGALRAMRVLPADAASILLACAARHESGAVAQMRVSFEGSFGWTAAQFDAALAATTATGLVRVDAPGLRWTLAPGLEQALEWPGFDWYAGAWGAPSPPLPLGFLLAVITAYAAENPPRIRAEGGIYVKWPEKAVARLAFPGIGTARIEGAAHLLLRLGVLRQHHGSGTRELRVAPASFDRVLGAPSRELSLATISGSGRDAAVCRAALGVLELATRDAARAKEAGASDGVTRDGVLHAAHRFPSLVRASLAFQVDEVDCAPLMVAQGLRLLREVGLVEIARQESGPRFRRAAAPAAAPAAKWIVQPNFEVLVPEDAPPAAVARLGLVADVVRLDRVTRFAISRESVERAMTVGATGVDALEILASNSAVPVPENVAETIRGWQRRAAPIRPYVGAFLVAATTEQAAFLRAQPGCDGEIAPNVFLFPPDAVDRVLVASAKAGHPASPVQSERGYYGGRFHHGSIAEAGDSDSPANELPATLAERVQAHLSAWANSTERTGGGDKGPTRSRAGRGETPSGRLPVMRDYTTEDIHTFRSTWPVVYRAVVSDHALLAIAMRLEAPSLRRVSALQAPSIIRLALEGVRSELASTQHEDGAAERGGSHSHGPGCRCRGSGHEDDGFDDDLDDDEDFDDDIVVGGADDDTETVLDRILRERPSRTKAPAGKTTRDASGARSAKGAHGARGVPPARSPSGKAAAPVAPPRPAPAAPQPNSDPTPWETPAPGELERRLREAAEGARYVEILYLNSAGRQAPRVVRPTEFSGGARPKLIGHCRDTNGRGEFLVERISAIRPVS